MISFKKLYREELLQLALLLSLLKVNNDPFQELDIYDGVNSLDFENGTSWRQITPAILRSHYVNPKSLDSVLLNYERDLFADVHSLGRFNRQNFRHPDVTTYLLNIERSAAVTTPETPPAPIPPNVTPPNETESSAAAASSTMNEGIGLSQEDMDLIEVLWKQDVDLGFSVENAAPKPEKPDAANENNADTNTDEIEKLKALQAINKDKEVKAEPEEDPWAGLDYTIDTETGEYVVKEDSSDALPGIESDPSCDLELGDLSLPIPEFLLDEALELVDLEDDCPAGPYVNLKDLENVPLDAANVSSTSTSGANLTSSEATNKADDPTASEGSLNAKEVNNDIDLLDAMIQTPQFHHTHHRAGFQTRMPFVRTMSMEQRWQDLANLLSLPGGPGGPGDAHGHGHGHPAFAHPLNYGHHHHPVGPGVSYATDASAAAARVLLHNASLAPPLHDFNSSVPYSNIGGTNLGNAVATSMNLTNSSEPMGESSSAPHYKLEPSHDVYYQNSTAEINQTDGFLSSILNDEDLQLMDMAMNEGLYTMRMLDGNNGTGANVSNVTAGASGVTAAPQTSIAQTGVMSRHDMERMDTSSDSAVSSMGSERVPSLSDGEWGDAGSDSGHTSSEHYVTDYQNKMRPYDYSYSSRHLNAGMTSSDSARIPPVAQKKHHMYGKRYFQEHNAAASASQAVPSTPMKYEYREPTSTSYLPNPADSAATGKMPEMKYSCSMEFGLQGQHLARNNIDLIQHNHTYHLPPESSGAMQRPLSRDKKKGGKAEDEHLTRDEKRARALNVPIAVDDIINLPMDEFNERLSKYDLSEAQLSLIRDIRRRGKNKVAAQNCRKRKLDQILSLADEVKEMRDSKMRLINEHKYTLEKCKRLKDKYQQLYRYVFQNLRDPDGNQYSPYHVSLQISADGTVVLVPRPSTNVTNPEQKRPATKQRLKSSA